MQTCRCGDTTVFSVHSSAFSRFVFVVGQNLTSSLFKRSWLAPLCVYSGALLVGFNLSPSSKQRRTPSACLNHTLTYGHIQYTLIGVLKLEWEVIGAHTSIRIEVI